MRNFCNKMRNHKGAYKMAKLKRMPPLIFDTAKMKKWGEIWLGTEGSQDKKTGTSTVKKNVVSIKSNK